MLIINEQDDRFYIKDSTIPQAGRGLFAKADLKKGDYLDIVGVMVPAGDDATYWANQYKFAATDDKYHLIPLGLAGMVNHSDDVSKRNAKMLRVGDTPRFKRMRREKKGKAPYSFEVIYEFSRGILKDEEILTDYGEGWKIQRKQMDEHRKLVTDEWQRFLSFDLYNLALLAEKIPLI